MELAKEVRVVLKAIGGQALKELVLNRKIQSFHHMKNKSTFSRLDWVILSRVCLSELHYCNDATLSV